MRGNFTGYLRHKHYLAKALDAITAHGLPVDRKRQDDLRAYLESEEQRLTSQIQQLVPDAVRPVNRKIGYKKLPNDLRTLLKERNLLKPKAKLDYYIDQHYDLCNSLDYYVRDLDIDYSGLVRVLPFNPNSSDQLLNYIRWQMDHGDMTKRWYVPVHIDTGNPTVGKDELKRLIQATDDEVLKLTYKIHKITKFKGTYLKRYWIPGADGRVHGTFRFGTAVQQTSCSQPNIQQYVEHYDPEDEWEADIAKRLKGCIKAEPGHKLVKVDMRGFHARMQSFLAEDSDYYRLASFDMHSFNTAQFVDHPLKNELRSMKDDELWKALKLIKQEHKHERDAYVKRCVAKGQLVLTNNGLKPIEKVLLDDRVWDGVEWVQHEGVIFQGIRSVVTYDSITATPDHEVFAQEGQKLPLWIAAQKQSQLAPTADKESPIRLPKDYFRTITSQEWLSRSESSMQSYWNHQMDWLDKLCQRENSFIQEVREILGCCTSAHWSQIRNCLQSLQSSSLSKLQRLWWSWYQAAVQLTQRFRRLRSEEAASQGLLGRFNRPQRQQWTLRTGQLAPCFIQTTGFEQTNYSLAGMARQKDFDVRFLAYQSLLFGSNTHLCKAGINWRTDSSSSVESSVTPKVLQELEEVVGSSCTARVYDILNAGPRNRFTVSGKLVANCSFLNQYGGGAEKAASILDLDVELVDRVLKAIVAPFPKVFRDFPKQVERQIRKHPRIISPHGCCRFFWNGDVKEAVAYTVSNPAHCHIQDALIRLFERGAFAKYGACNFPHDALWYHCRNELVDECIAVTKEEFEKPSDVLINSLGAFWCSADAQVGDSLAEVRDY